MAAKESSKEAVMLLLWRGITVHSTTDRTKRLRLSIFMRILLPLTHLLHERFRLLFIHEGEACKAIFKLTVLDQHDTAKPE